MLPLSSAAGWVFASLWLAACGLLLAGAGLRFARSEAWWSIALCAALLSQALVVVACPDAKLGRLANVLILAAAAFAGAHARFVAGVDAEARTLLASSAPHVAAVSREQLGQLPAPVQRWLQASGVVGREAARTVRLKQRGQLRTAPDAAWMPAQAEQYFSLAAPGCVWRVDARMGGRDRRDQRPGNSA